MKKINTLFVTLILSFAFFNQIDAQNNQTENKISNRNNQFNRPNMPRFSDQGFPYDKPTEESFWRVYREQAERELRLIRHKYPNIRFDNMTEFLYDPEVNELYYGIMLDYRNYLNDPRRPRL